MGKQSKRKEKKTDEQDVVYQGKHIKMPPSRPGWKTFTQANRELETMGFRECKHVPHFTSAQLVTEIDKILEKGGVDVFDATKIVPEGPNADWTAWPFAGYELNKRALDTPNTVFVVLRTKHNTPGFLGGNTYGHALQLGGIKEAIEQNKKDTTTPCGMIMYQGRLLRLPTAVVQGSPMLAARIISAMIERDESAFCCAVCMESLIRVEGSDVNDQVMLKSFVATDCDHAFHPDCIMGHIRAGGQSCPICRGSLPVTLVADDERSEKPEKPKEWQWGGESIGRLDPKNPQDRPAIMNALADRVRNAMIEDGLDPPTDAQRFQ